MEEKDDGESDTEEEFFECEGEHFDLQKNILNIFRFTSF